MRILYLVSYSVQYSTYCTCRSNSHSNCNATLVLELLIRRHEVRKRLGQPSEREAMQREDQPDT